MLFRDKIDAACAYCSHGRSGEDDDILCAIHGIVKPWDRCSRFRYDPLRRVPEAAPLPKTDVDPASFDL